MRQQCILPSSHWLEALSARGIMLAASRINKARTKVVEARENI